MLFTDYYAEASCTAGRANFITGEIPLRTGLTTVGQAGADVGLPAQACTLATALKAQGTRRASSAKTISAISTSSCRRCTASTNSSATFITSTRMSDPYLVFVPLDQKYYNEHGPRSLVHCWATDTDDDHGDAALGQGRQAEDRRRRPAAPVPGHVERAEHA